MAVGEWVETLWAGRTALALDLLRKESESLSKLCSLGAIYMWTGEFQSVLAHFEPLLDKPIRIDFFFGMAGAAAWCTGDLKRATRHWRKGVTCPAAVAGSNTRTALLLYAASVLEPNAYSTEAAKKILKSRLAKRRGGYWPGQIAQFLLEADREDEARQASFDPNQRNFLNVAVWTFRFYVLLKKMLSRDISPSDFTGQLHELVALEASGYLELKNLSYFLRCEEFYLARNWCGTHRLEGEVG